MWALLRERRAARFPFPITDRIPNFVGAERAAARRKPRGIRWAELSEEQIAAMPPLRALRMTPRPSGPSSP